MPRIIPAMATSTTMTLQEIDHFLSENKIPLLLGTTDSTGDANIHPLWYNYENGKFYLITATDSRKINNIKRKKRVYFCVDTESIPAKGVKGKGSANILKNTREAGQQAEKIISRYLGNIDNPLGKALTKRVSEGKEVIVEISPLYYSVWDDSKSD